MCISARGKGSVMVANKFRDIGCSSLVVDQRGLLDGFDLAQIVIFKSSIQKYCP